MPEDPLKKKRDFHPALTLLWSGKKRKTKNRTTEEMKLYMRKWRTRKKVLDLLGED